jgi:hypothetical protein
VQGDGTFDSDEYARFQNWVESHWKHGPCPVCESNQWAPNDRIGQIFNDQTLETGQTFPVLLIFCTTCGYTLPVNARIAGIRVGDDQEEDEEDEANEAGQANDSPPVA